MKTHPDDALILKGTLPPMPATLAPEGACYFHDSIRHLSRPMANGAPMPGDLRTAAARHASTQMGHVLDSCERLQP